MEFKTGDIKSSPAEFIGKNFGKYRVEEILGRGGMGVVFKVWDTLEEEHKAIKILPPEIAYADLALEDLKREVKSARKITHANIVKIFSLEQEGDLYFIVMEYVKGENLAKKLASTEQRKLKEEVVVEIMKQLSEGIDAAHKNNVIHRDLKPQNIMITEDGTVKILDFGISYQIAKSTMQVTGEPPKTGTWPYMAPEQLSNKFGRENQQVDIWGFGATVYHLLTGEVPFRYKEQITDPEEKPFDIKGVSKTTLDIVMKCLQKDRLKRFSRMGQITEALARKEREELLQKKRKEEEKKQKIVQEKIIKKTTQKKKEVISTKTDERKSKTREFKGAPIYLKSNIFYRLKTWAHKINFRVVIVFLYVFITILPFLNQSITEKIVFLRTSAFIAKLDPRSSAIMTYYERNGFDYQYNRKIKKGYRLVLDLDRLMEEISQKIEYIPLEVIWMGIVYIVDLVLCFLILVVLNFIVLIIMTLGLVAGIVLCVISFIVLGIFYLFGARQAFDWVTFGHLFPWHYLPSWKLLFTPLVDMHCAIFWIAKIIFVILNNLPLIAFIFLLYLFTSFLIEKFSSRGRMGF